MALLGLFSAGQVHMTCVKGCKGAVADALGPASR